MALIGNDISKPGPAQIAVLRRIEQAYGLEVTRFVSMVRDMRPYDLSTVYTLRYKPIPMPTGLSEVMAQIAQLLGDDFRGPIIAAAVPDLHAAQVKACALFKETANPQELRLTDQHINELMEHTNGAVSYRGVRNTPLDHARERAHRHDGPSLPSLYP